MRLVNTDRPNWLVGMTEMTKTFGLELLESVLSDFQPVFFKVINFCSFQILSSVVIKIANNKSTFFKWFNITEFMCN